MMSVSRREANVNEEAGAIARIDLAALPRKADNGLRFHAEPTGLQTPMLISPADAPEYIGGVKAGSGEAAMPPCHPTGGTPP